MRSLLCLALAGLLLPQAPAPAAPAENTPFLLAVLNRDGLALPFAAFTGRRWTAPWPDRQRGVMPISLDDVERGWWGIGGRPERMSAWLNGERLGTVTFTSLAQVPTLCSARLGLRTDHTSRQLAPPRLRQPYPKDALLVSDDVPVGRIDTVDRATDDAARVLGIIGDEFNRMERRAIGAFDAWRHPFAESDRRRQPVVIEALYRAPSDAAGWTTYFVESVRRYPARREEGGCGLVTVAQGWVHAGPGGNSEVELSSRITYCDLKGVGFMLPFGTVRAGGRTHWVYQYSGYEDEFYQVVRPEPDDIRVMVAYHAGSCPE